VGPPSQRPPPPRPPVKTPPKPPEKKQKKKKKTEDGYVSLELSTERSLEKGGDSIEICLDLENNRF